MGINRPGKTRVVRNTGALVKERIKSKAKESLSGPRETMGVICHFLVDDPTDHSSL